MLQRCGHENDIDGIFFKVNGNINVVRVCTCTNIHIYLNYFGDVDKKARVLFIPKINGHIQQVEKEVRTAASEGDKIYLITLLLAFT